MREVAGVVVVVVALAVAPAGYFWSSIWWTVSVALAVAGLLLFYSARVQRRERKDRELASGDDPGDAVERYSPGPLNPNRARRADADSSDAGDDFDGD